MKQKRPSQAAVSLPVSRSLLPPLKGLVVLLLFALFALGLVEDVVTVTAYHLPTTTTARAVAE
ncbi:MAG: hypothetical protein WBP22_01025 [Candidatus Saccharimonas sp.]